MSGRRKVQTRGVEEARKTLPALLDAAAKGHITIITRRGSAVAAIVPATEARAVSPTGLLALEGSGKGLWGRASTKTVARLRDEWNR